MPRCTESLRVSPAASKPSTAHAVCDGVLGADAPQVRIVIAPAGLAPAAVSVLHHAQPLGGLLDIGSLLSTPIGVQPAQHQQGAVDVVHAPAAEPGAVRLLLFAE